MPGRASGEALQVFYSGVALAEQVYHKPALIFEEQFRMVFQVLIILGLIQVMLITVVVMHMCMRFKEKRALEILQQQTTTGIAGRRHLFRSTTAHR